MTPELDADAIFGPLSAPMPSAVKAARRVLAGETLDDELVNTDTSLAAGFALDNSHRLKWDVQRQSWMICNDAAIWKPDTSLLAPRFLQGWTEDRAFSQVTEAASKRDLDKVRAASRLSLSAPKQRQLLELAKHQELLVDAGQGWDLDPWVLATKAGQLVDLKSGSVRSLLPDDRVTRTTAVEIDPAAHCDRWRRFIEEIADEDATLVDMLAKAVSYSITGDISEQVFFCNLGPGGNGKSLFMETVAYVLGDLAGSLPFAALTRDRNTGSVQAELADLPGARFVRASEVREDAYFDEGRLKALTGGDPISAARKYAHPFTYRPAFKLWLAVNHRPRVSDQTHGFWRRAMIIPFNRTFPGDKRLEGILRDEAPGILAWMVEACLEWQKHGLPRPAAAEAARQEWRESEDVIAQWADTALAADPLGRTRSSQAFEAFRAWADAEGLTNRERPGRKKFGEWMTAHYAKKHTKSGQVYAAKLVTGDGLDPSLSKPSHARPYGEGLQNEHHDPSPVTAEATDGITGRL